MNRSLIFVFVGGAIAIAGCDPSGAESRRPTSLESTTPSVDRVTAGPPVRKTVTLQTRQPARIEAFAETRIFPKLPGYVEEVTVEIGDVVGKGQLLARLRIPELIDDVEQKKELVKQMEAEADQARAGLQAIKAAQAAAAARVTEAESSVGRVEGEYARWDSERQRIQQLVSSGTVTAKLADETLSQFRAAEAARKEARARIESATAEWRQAEANIGKSDADVTAAIARVAVAKAHLRIARTMLGYAQMAAPFDGVVTERNIDVGQFVHPANAVGSQPMLVVTARERVRVVAQIPETEATWVDADTDGQGKGDPATVRVAALGNREFHGRVTRSSWALDKESRSLRVEIDLDNPEMSLHPGGFAEVTIMLAQRDDVLTLPVGALVREGDQVRCCVVVDGAIAFCPIELGLHRDDAVEVTSGLSGGEAVVLARASSLREGQAVEIVP